MKYLSITTTLLMALASTTLMATEVPSDPYRIEVYKNRITYTTARIKFRENSTNELGFHIYNNGELLETLPAHEGTGKIRHELEGLSAGTTYNLTVKAFNSEGESGASNLVTLTTQGSGEEAAGLPEAPLRLELYHTRVTETTARIKFRDYATDELGFHIYSNGVLIKTIDSYEGIGKVRCELEGLTANTNYTLSVKSFNDMGESEASNLITFKTKNSEAIPLAPQKVKDIRYQGFFLTGIEFEDHSLNELGFHIYNDGALIKTIEAHDGEGEKIVVGLDDALEKFPAGTVANIIVKSFNDMGESEASDRLLYIPNFNDERANPYSLNKTDRTGLYEVEIYSGEGSVTWHEGKFFYIKDGKVTYTNLAYDDFTLHGYGKESSFSFTQERVFFDSLHTWIDDYNYDKEYQIMEKATYDIVDLSNIFMLSGERRECEGLYFDEKGTLLSYELFSEDSKKWTTVYDKKSADVEYSCYHQF